MLIGLADSTATGTNEIFTTPDAVTFTARQSPAAQRQLMGAFGNGRFVVPGYQKAVGMYSDNGGATWTAMSMPANAYWANCVFNGAVFLAIAGHELATTVSATSLDGITWTARTMPASVKWAAEGLAWGAGVFVATYGDNGATSTCYTSPDGITWTARTLPSSDVWCSVVWTGTQFIVGVNATGSTACATSPDGITWTARTGQTGGFRKIVWSNYNQLAVATKAFTNQNLISTSPDGITWTNRTLPSTSQWDTVYWDEGCRKFIATIYNTTNGATSGDGVTWSAVTFPSSNFWASFVSDQGWASFPIAVVL